MLCPVAVGHSLTCPVVVCTLVMDVCDVLHAGTNKADIHKKLVAEWRDMPVTEKQALRTKFEEARTARQHDNLIPPSPPPLHSGTSSSSL